jgi:hypothetical protein
VNDLQTLTVQVQSIAESGLPLDQIRANLENLWNTAQDDQQRQLINVAWEHAQGLAQLTETAVTYAQSAIEFAREMGEQRDVIADTLAEAVKKHTELEKAVKDGDYGVHPAVDDLIQTVQEQAYADFNESVYAEGIHEDDPEMTIDENGHFGDEFDSSAAVELIEIILTGDEMEEDMLTELGNFITDFVGRYRAWRDAKWEAQRKKWATEAEARKQQQKAVS